MTRRRKHFISFIAWVIVPVLLQAPLIPWAEAQTKKLVIKTVDAGARGTDPTGVRATIMIRSLHLAEQPFADITASGTYEAEPFECEAGMNFRAEPKAKMYYISTDEMKPCSYDGIVFSFSRNAYASRIKGVIEMDYSLFPKITPLGKKLTEALDADAYGDVTVLATEIKNQFTALGRPDLASDAGLVAYQAAGMALGVDEQLRFDPVQKDYVMPPEMVSAIQALQAKSKVKKTGKIDWKTMDILSNEFGNGAINTITKFR